MSKDKLEADRLYFARLADVVTPRSTELSPDQTKRLSLLPTRKGMLAEALLFSDQLVLDVTGPNLQLPLLLNFFGSKILHELLEENVINFAYCPGTITYLTTEKIRAIGLSTHPGINRIVGVDLAWSDPFESADMALREQTTMKRGDRRFLARLVTRNTKVLPADKVYQEGVRLANADLRSDLGKRLGFTPEDIPENGDFGKEKEDKFRDLTHYNMLYLCMVMSKCVDTVSDELAYSVLQNRVVIEPKYQGQVKIVHTLLDFEDVPDVKTLVASGQLTLKAILDIRSSAHLREFRKWLKTLPAESKEIEVLKAYRRAIDNKISSKPLYKILKLGIFTGAGTLVGSLAGPAGTVLGGLAGAATDFAIGFTDSFFIDRLVDGWNPKIFIQKEIKSKI